MERCEERIGFEIRRLDHMLARNLQAHVKTVGIDEVTLMHGWIIRYLYANRDKDIFQKDIERYFSIGRSTVKNIIQLMEKKGFIVRESVEYDARLKKVILTDKGIQNHESLERLIESLGSSLTEEELSVFHSVIGKLTANLMKEVPGGNRCIPGRFPAGGKEETDDPDFIA